MPDAPADDSSDQPVPAAAEPPAPPPSDPEIPLLPDPPRAPATPPGPLTPPPLAEPPTAVTPPAYVAPPPAVEPPTAVAPPAYVAPPPAVEPATVVAPPTGVSPPAAVEPATVVAPGGVPETAVWDGPPVSAYPATAPWQAPAPWPPAAYAGQPALGYPPGWTGAPPPPPGFRYPGIGAPAPKRSRAAMIITVVAVVVVLACLGFGTAVFFAVRHLGDAAPATKVPTDYPTDLPTDDPTDDQQPDPEPTHDGDIKRYVIERSATAHTWPKVKADEALNLDAAAANFSNPAEGKLVLKRYGFKDGYARRWVDETGSYVTVRVLRFADAGDGDNFASFYIDANQASGWGEPDDVPGVPDAAGFVKPKPEKNGFQRSMAVGDSADIVAIVIADQPPPARPSIPDKLLATEFGLL